MCAMCACHVCGFIASGVVGFIKGNEIYRKWCHFKISLSDKPET